MEQINYKPKKELRECICCSCGVIRFAVLDFEACKKAGKLIAKPCPVCKCPNILLKQHRSKK